MATIADPTRGENASTVFGTIMVGRFEGFPSLVRAVGRMAMPDVSRRVHDTLDYYIQQYRGVVVQAKGDGVVALFTAGDDDDNHAVRALGAAVSIRRAFAGEFMTVRTSVHSGYVTVPDTLGIVCSLGEATEDNHISASDRTVELAQGQFEFRSVGRHLVDGVGEVDMFELLAVAKNHAGKLNSYLYQALEPHDGDADTMGHSFPVLRDIIQGVRQ